MNQRDSNHSHTRFPLTVEQSIHAFEEAWLRGEEPPLRAFLDPASSDSPRLPYELIVIDMEFRWKMKVANSEAAQEPGRRPHWSDYIRQFPETLELALIPVEFVAEEYRIRRVWGDSPSHEQFASAFPEQRPRLGDWLTRIDQELAADDLSPAGKGESSPTAPGNVIAADPRAPLPWSDYLLLEHIGSGGFGRVYRAVQKSLGRNMAVKALRKVHQTDPAIVEQFIREARVLAQLQHDGIVGVHGLGRFPGGGYFLVLDLVEGHDLQQQLQRGPLPVAQAVQVTVDVARAIQHAHERRVIHGDLKPSNVLISETGRVFVTDFGLARLRAPERGTALQVLGGTRGYLAPEVVRSGSLTIAVDVYGLGALLYALLTGQPPWPNQGALRTSDKMLDSNHTPALPSICSTIPRQLESIVMRCLDAQPKQRFSTADEFAQAWNTAQRDVPIERPWSAHANQGVSRPQSYSLVTTPDPTVLPPSRTAK